MSIETLTEISKLLSLPPFGNTLTPAQLDNLTLTKLLEILTNVARHISNEIRDQKGVSDLLETLNYDTNSQTWFHDKPQIFDTLQFLLLNLESHKTRVYLSKYLQDTSVPLEFTNQDAIVQLQAQIRDCQEEFRAAHSYLVELQAVDVQGVKKDIKLMEAERLQVLGRLARLRSRIANVPGAEKLLESAKVLRREQNLVIESEDRLRAMEGEYGIVERRYQTLVERSSAIEESLTADGVFSKLEQEIRVNKYLSTVHLPKSVTEATRKLQNIREILDRDVITDSDLIKIEAEINENNRINSDLAEKLRNNANGDVNLGLLRQQASIISAKRDGLATRLRDVHEELQNVQLKVSNNEKQQNKLLVGDEFQKYVSELRTKSAKFKLQKAEFDSISMELSILSRTKEILSQQVSELSIQLEKSEKEHGISGYSDTRATLETVSLMKREKDKEKGQALEEISSIIQNLVKSINDKKNTLAPVIQRLRALREDHQSLSSKYEQARKAYDSVMREIELEISRLEEDIESSKTKHTQNQAQYQYTTQLIEQCERDSERVSIEMKCYIGTDESIVTLQKERGFKSYRDLYIKKIQEGELEHSKLLDDRENAEVKDRYNEMKSLIRMSWHRDNLKNLLNAKLPDLQRLTVYQQKWIAKKHLRGYHVPNINEKQFLDRHFKAQLPIKIHPKEVREKLPPIQSIMFGNLERRIDVVVFRSLFASSIWNARQMTVHGHVKVNGEVCRYPARELNDGDMITVSPSAISMLNGTKFTPFPYMAPWMFVPTYLEVCFATCSAVFLRSPLVQPGLMEIPSPYPPNWHQLVYEWYAQKQKAQVKSPLKKQLIINGKAVKLKPKFDRLIRRDQYLALKSLNDEKMQKRKAAADAERRNFNSS